MIPVKSEEIKKGESLKMLSDNVASIMKAIASNANIRILLSNNKIEPYDMKKEDIPSPADIMSPTSEHNKIKPVAFDLEVTEETKTEVRVYYSMGRMAEGGVVQDCNMHIDIICAKSLWTIRDKAKHTKFRPYEIMSSIHDEIGRNNRHGVNFGKMLSFQLLSVNDKFEAIRIFFNTTEYTKFGNQ